MSLPTIHGTNPNKILDFYEKLWPKVPSLGTMEKLGEVNGYFWMTLNKLEGIRNFLNLKQRYGNGRCETRRNAMTWKIKKTIQAINEAAIQATYQTASIYKFSSKST